VRGEAQAISAATEVAKVEARLQAAGEARKQGQVGLDEAGRAAQALDLEMEQLRKQQDWFNAQKRALEKEQQSAEAQIVETERTEQKLADELAGAQKALDAHSQGAVDTPLDDLHQQAAHWEMSMAVSQRALQESQRRTGERQQALQRAQGQTAAQQERLRELEAQVTSIEQEKVQLSAQEGNVGGEIASVVANIAPAEKELAQSDLELNELQLGETNAMQALSSAERTHTQAQITLARQQEALETLRARIEDDFGLVEFQYDASVSGPTPLPLGELVEHLPVVEELAPELEETLREQRSQIRRLGSVNPEAQQEFASVKERVESMQEQVTDLRAAEVDLRQVIAELDVLMDKEFRNTFERVAAEFKDIFSRLFAGGSAKLLLTEEEDMTTTGIDIETRLPGKRSQRLALLSGGERSLTAAALVFSLLKASPTPFCVMDEVDAMLDEANVGRFTDLLRELSKETQFVVITHNRNTVQVADVIYGVTMGRDTASQVISLKLDEVDERYSQVAA
jgi:chromosome segregation protein